jgi:apolipoprotein N-acyltransferase
MQYLVSLGFGIIYLLFFLPLYFTKKPYIRALLLFGLSFVTPFSWKWLEPELLFVHSYIGIYKYQLALLLLALVLLKFKKPYRYIVPPLLLLGALNYGYTQPKEPHLKIKLVATDIPQNEKWTRKALYPTVSMIFANIDNAIKEHYDLVIFPESVFPLYLNKNQQLLNALQERSKKIAIVVGALLREDEKNYNVSYLFQNGSYQVAKKLVLVPFGEYIPLPKFAKKFVNETFFNGASDFVTAKKPTDFIIKGVKFRNAICYEATTDDIYAGGNIKYVIAMSNNAWFAPSIEPTLQKILLEYFAKKEGVIIYHAANYKGSAVIK